MMLSKGVEMMPMNSNIMMGNGSSGMNGGTYRLKDSTTVQMKEGQRMMNGEMMIDGQMNHLKR